MSTQFLLQASDKSLGVSEVTQGKTLMLATHPLQRLADCSTRVSGLHTLQVKADCFTRASAAQRQPKEEGAVQDCFISAKLAVSEEDKPLQRKFTQGVGQLHVMRRVTPTTEVNSVPVNDDPALEHEAGVMGEKAAQFVLGEEEPVQGQFSAVTQKATATPNRTGLPDNLKAGVENLSGMRMDGVRVHYNSDKPAQLNALAYAQGADIHVGPGQEKHLPHDAWHVVQQFASGGGAMAQGAFSNGAVNATDSINEGRSLAIKSAPKSTVFQRKGQRGGTNDNVVQRTGDFAEDLALENVEEERGDWANIPSRFGLSIEKYMEYINLFGKEPSPENQPSSKEAYIPFSRVDKRKLRAGKKLIGKAQIPFSGGDKRKYRAGKKSIPRRRLRLSSADIHSIRGINLFDGIGQDLLRRGLVKPQLAGRSGFSSQLAVQRVAIWNFPAMFPAPLNGFLAAAPNATARFDAYMQNRPHPAFLADWAANQPSIAGKLRRPGGHHEWAPVSQAPHMQQNWFSAGLTHAAYSACRTPTGGTNFAARAAPAVAIPHGGPGSPAAHGELYGLVLASPTWAAFNANLNSWATGVSAGHFYRAHNGTIHNPPSGGAW